MRHNRRGGLVNPLTGTEANVPNEIEMGLDRALEPPVACGGPGPRGKALRDLTESCRRALPTRGLHRPVEKRHLGDARSALAGYGLLRAKSVEG